MKTMVLLGSALLSSGLAWAGGEKMVILKDATISLCAPQLLGCAPRISNAKESYLLDTRYAEEFLSQLPPGDSSVKVREAAGIAVEETGHFPNPMAKFSVFKVLKIVE